MLHAKGQPMTAHSEDRLIAIAEVMAVVGFGKTIIYRWIKLGTFPPPCHPGGASSRWSEAEVREWMRVQLAERPRSKKPH